MKTTFLPSLTLFYLAAYQPHCKYVPASPKNYKSTRDLNLNIIQKTDATSLLHSTAPLASSAMVTQAPDPRFETDRMIKQFGLTSSSHWEKFDESLSPFMGVRHPGKELWPFSRCVARCGFMEAVSGMWQVTPEERTEIVDEHPGYVPPFACTECIDLIPKSANLHTEYLHEVHWDRIETLKSSNFVEELDLPNSRPVTSLPQPTTTTIDSLRPKNGGSWWPF